MNEILSNEVCDETTLKLFASLPPIEEPEESEGELDFG